MVAGAGIGYLTGHGVGGLLGTREGVGRMEPTQPSRIKMTTLVNSLTKRGPEWANRFGVIGETFSSAAQSNPDLPPTSAGSSFAWRAAI